MKTHTLAFAALFGAFALNSCIFQQVASKFTRDPYPGDLPPHVIADNGGKPAANNWAKVQSTDLPAAGSLTREIKYAADGLPYGLPCEFANIIVSPYAPHYQLDYTGTPVGAKVWDPYTRKPFYIPRLYTVN